MVMCRDVTYAPFPARVLQAPDQRRRQSTGRGPRPRIDEDQQGICHPPPTILLEDFPTGISRSIDGPQLQERSSSNGPSERLPPNGVPKRGINHPPVISLDLDDFPSKVAEFTDGLRRSSADETAVRRFGCLAPLFMAGEMTTEIVKAGSEPSYGCFDDMEYLRRVAADLDAVFTDLDAVAKATSDVMEAALAKPRRATDTAQRPGAGSGGVRLGLNRFADLSAKSPIPGRGGWPRRWRRAHPQDPTVPGPSRGIDPAYSPHLAS